MYIKHTKINIRIASNPRRVLPCWFAEACGLDRQAKNDGPLKIVCSQPENLSGSQGFYTPVLYRFPACATERRQLGRATGLTALKQPSCPQQIFWHIFDEYLPLMYPQNVRSGSGYKQTKFLLALLAALFVPHS